MRDVRRGGGCVAMSVATAEASASLPSSCCHAEMRRRLLSSPSAPSLSLSLRCDRLAPLVPLAPEEGEGFMCHLFADNTRSQTAQSPFPLSHFGPGKVVDLKIECNIMVDVQMVKMPLLPRLLTLIHLPLRSTSCVHFYPLC